MTEGLLGGRYQTVREIGELVSITFIALVVFVFAIAPYNVLTFRSAKLSESIAGLLGLFFWAVAIGTLVGGL